MKRLFAFVLTVALLPALGCGGSSSATKTTTGGGGKAIPAGGFEDRSSGGEKGGKSNPDPAESGKKRVE